ncbi:cysteine hydrolase [Ruegeria arenilitoris]|uniref:cysteine hydrolase n=1 Tax=Ruegeria arenilitoris TaxID=1173585 RepID=UPI00147F83CC|nr:cysteine hydrolase [Ruegeria arenilitoris]
MSVLWIIVAGIVIAVLYILIEIRRIGTPTTGPAIDLAVRPKTALVVIDMQTDFTSAPGWDAAELDAAISNIRDSVKQAREDRMPVIAIRHVFKGKLANLLNGWFNQGRGNEGSAGIETDPRLGLNADTEFVKTVGDAFSSTAFEQFLEDNQIGTLILTGLDGCHCVNKTAQGALNRGYRVHIDPTAVLAANPAHWAKVKEKLEVKGAELRGLSA